MYEKSKQPRKQRKAQYNASNVRRSKMVGAHLSADLSQEYGKRSVRVIKGDTVKVMRGDAEIVGVEGKVTDIDTIRGLVVIEGITIPKADGTQKARPLHASNLMVTKLELKDPRRKAKLEKKEVSQ
jgi:large subunit ribosomal protein L24